MVLQIAHERHEVAVAREEDDRVEFGRSGDGVDRKPDVPVGLFGAAGEYLQVFEAHFDAHFGERFEKAFFFAAFGRYRIGAGAHEAAAGDGIFEDVAEIDARMIDIFRAVIEILRVDEYADTLFWMFDDSHTK